MTRNWVIELRPSTTADPVEPCCPPAFSAAAVATLGAEPVAWAAQVALAAEEKVLAFSPQLAEPSSRDVARRPIEACVVALLETLYADTGADPARVPELVISGNRDLVHRGIPLEQVLRAVWTSHVHVHQELLTFLERQSNPEVLGAEVRHLTELSFAFADVLSSRLTAEFVAERKAWRDSAQARRRQVVDELVGGRRPSVRNTEQVLGLNLERHLVAAVVWTEAGGSGAADSGVPARMARAVGAASGAANLLVVPVSATLAWLWMAFPGAPPDKLAATLREGLIAPAETGVALGPVRYGADGFRHSHLAALRILRLGCPPSTPHEPWLFDHAELDLLALLTDEPEHAGWFVRDQLGRLAESDPRIARLRETLRLYLRFGRSRSAAAKALHVVPNTVAYRIRQAEELLGASIPSDSLRLRVALEICELVTPSS